MASEADITGKEQTLRMILQQTGSSVIAYSGGVDSTLLAYLASRELGNKTVAVTAVSASIAPDELEETKQIAKILGLNHVLLTSQEMENPQYLENTPQRCYWCKNVVFRMLSDYAKQFGYSCVLDGTNYDDKSDIRPGRTAAQELGILSPLLDACFTKVEIRTLARQLGLPNWDKPAMACLSSRIPYGTAISPELLLQVARAEQLIKSFAIKTIRVRHHGEIARLEVDPSEFQKLIENRACINEGLRELGFMYITMDLNGYQTGSLNQLIK